VVSEAHDADEAPGRDACARVDGLVEVDVSTKLIRNAPGLAKVRLRGAAAREREGVLSRRLIEVQEAERRAVARELHDEIGQTLTALKINLQALPSMIDLATQRRIDESVAMVGRLLDQVRAISLDLRPSVLDDWGLTAAVRWYAERHSEHSGLVVTVRSRLGDDRFPTDIETGCFRITQEAVTNAMRHAHAQRMTIDLRRQNGGIKVVMSDDGQGFDVAAARQRAAAGASLGLLGMQERTFLLGGDLRIVSTPGRGTKVNAWIPFRASP
jgi:signal transduction histidine kinase